MDSEAEVDEQNHHHCGGESSTVIHSNINFVKDKDRFPWLQEPPDWPGRDGIVPASIERKAPLSSYTTEVASSVAQVEDPEAESDDDRGVVEGVWVAQRVPDLPQVVDRRQRPSITPLDPSSQPSIAPLDPSSQPSIAPLDPSSQPSIISLTSSSFHPPSLNAQNAPFKHPPNCPPLCHHHPSLPRASAASVQNSIFLAVFAAHAGAFTDCGL